MATAEASFTAFSEPSFRTVRRGLDPEEVRAHLDRVAAYVRDLESQLQRQVTHPGAPPAPFGGVSAYIVELLRSFDEDVKRLRARTFAEAERTQAEARVEAQMELVKARFEADRIRRGAAGLRSSTLGDLRTVRERLASSLQELEAALPQDGSEDRVVLLGEAEDPAPDTTEERSARVETRPQLAG